MLNLLDRIDGGTGHEGDLDRVGRLGEHIQRTALCDVGRSAASTVLANLETFRRVWEAHLGGAGCPPAAD